MTITPRQLSDAIKADHDEILDGRAEEARAIGRWTLTRTISGWIAAGIAIGVAGIFVMALFTGSGFGLILFAMLVLISPLLFSPALLVWFIAAMNVHRLEARRREMMFTQYGVTVDRTVAPHAYSVSGLPAAWLRPEMHRTRTLLLGETAAEEPDANL